MNKKIFLNKNIKLIKNKFVINLKVFKSWYLKVFKSWYLLFPHYIIFFIGTKKICAIKD